MSRFANDGWFKVACWHWVICACIALLSFAVVPSHAQTTQPLGTKVAEFDRAVWEMVRDPSRPRIYATTSLNTVLVINTQTLQIEWEVPIGSDPRGLDISPDGTRLYVANQGSTTAGIGVIDLTTLTKLPSLPTVSAVSDVAAGSNGRLYVLGASIQQIDSTTGAVQASVSGNQNGESVNIYGGMLAITPDRKTLYYADNGLSPASLYRIDVQGSAPILLQKSPHGSLGSNGLDLILNADGSALCYAVGSGNRGYDISLIPANDINGRIGSFNTDAYPSNGAFSPDGSTFYAAPDSQDTVKVFNTTTFVKEASFSIPDDVRRLLCDGRGRYLFAASNAWYSSSPQKLRVYAVKQVPTPKMTSVDATTAHQDENFSYQLTSDQEGVKWSASGLPAGLTIDSQTGIISGAPTVAGKFVVNVTLTGAEANGTGKLTITVRTPFTVTVNGEGTVSDGFLGTTWREVGDSFFITAAATSPNTFLDWSGALSSTSSTLWVTVQPKMTLQANFGRTTTITLNVTGPGSIAQFSPGMITRLVGSSVTVTAKPQTGAQFVGWTGSIESQGATLTFTVASEPMTLTANFEAISSNIAVTITTDGPGAVTPAYAGTTLHGLGDRISVQAVPGSGARFVSWSGASTSIDPRLLFQVEGNTNLIAHFESMGLYSGRYQLLETLLSSAEGRSSLGLTLNAAGSFTANLTVEKQRYVFTGSFLSPAGFDIVLWRKKTGEPIFVHLELSRPGGVPAITGTIDTGNGPSTLAGYRLGKFTRRIPASQQGRYTFVLPPKSDPNQQLEWGYGTVQVSNFGTAKLRGVLGDGTPVSSRGPLTENGLLRINTSLYRGKGSIEGWLQFGNDAQSNLTGSFTWLRPAMLKTRYLAGELAIEQSIDGSRIANSGPDASVLPFSNGEVTLNGGILGEGWTIPVILGASNTVVPSVPNINGLQLVLDPATSSFSGSFLSPGATTGKRRYFRGVIDARNKRAVGQFSTAEGCGSVILRERVDTISTGGGFNNEGAGSIVIFR